MRINRVICICFIISSGIFASCFGGNISYGLFYLSISIPVISFLYTLYLYKNFKLYQSLDRNRLVKGDWVDYYFVIGNENWLTFRYIKCIFLKDRSTIEGIENITQYSLLPNDRERIDTRLRCNYRGEYCVGVDAIEVTDFLNLFTIRYPIDTKLKAVVLPRIVILENLIIGPAIEDMKNPRYISDFVEEELDQEVRNYVPSDHKKRIHWKASAKQGSLVSRKYLHKPKMNINIFMDLVPLKGSEIEKIIIEDKIIESTLSIVNYYATREIETNIIYDKKGLQKFYIHHRRDFLPFYQACGELIYHGTIPIEQLLLAALSKVSQGRYSVIITHNLSKELFFVAQQIASRGAMITVIWISDDMTEASKQLKENFISADIGVYQIMLEDEIEPILTGINK